MDQFACPSSKCITQSPSRCVLFQGNGQKCHKFAVNEKETSVVLDTDGSLGKASARICDIGCNGDCEAAHCNLPTAPSFRMMEMGVMNKFVSLGERFPLLCTIGMCQAVVPWMQQWEFFQTGFFVPCDAFGCLALPALHIVRTGKYVLEDFSNTINVTDSWGQYGISDSKQ